MATKHYLQHYLFSSANGPSVLNLTQAVIHLETVAHRLQHIQVSTFVHLLATWIMCVHFSNCRSYIMKDLVWNLQHNSI